MAKDMVIVVYSNCMHIVAVRLSLQCQCLPHNWNPIIMVIDDHLTL